jgi:hypothetical protein
VNKYLFDWMGRMGKLIEPIGRSIKTHQGGRSPSLEEEIKTYRTLGRDMNRPVRIMRWPLWAQIARDHGHVLKVDEEGRVVYIGPKHLLGAYYEAARGGAVYEGEEKIKGFKAFLSGIVDEDHMPINYDSQKVMKKEADFLKYPEIAKDFEKMYKR